MIPVINIMLMPFVSIGENLTFHVFSLRTCFIHTYSFDDCLYSSLSQRILVPSVNKIFSRLRLPIMAKETYSRLVR